ncbi:S-layer homology domain-containing protein [Butyricicoccus pullicaecorum]|nr:S-layer homology domain-containing protein [Butyricicoccus pullicaecorum]
MKKRFWACFLSLSLVLTMMPTMAFAADDEVNEPEGTVEVCVETEGCTLEAGHEGECVVVESKPEEPENVPCKVTEGCTLENGHEGECVVAESEPEEPESVPCTVTEGCTLEDGHEGGCVLKSVDNVDDTDEIAADLVSVISQKASPAETQLREAIQSASTDADNPTVITIEEDITLSQYIDVPSDKHFILEAENGAKITVDAETVLHTDEDAFEPKYDAIFQFENTTNASMTLRDITIDGNNLARLIHLGATNSLTMEDGSILQNGRTFDASSESGAAIWMKENSDFTMNGGEIIYNSAARYGGGIYCWAAGSTITINDGLIANNTGNYAGGIVILGNMSLYLNGGVITDNRGTNTTHAGGIFIHGDSHCYLSGNAEIINNTFTTSDSKADIYINSTEDKSKITVTDKFIGRTTVKKSQWRNPGFTNIGQTFVTGTDTYQLTAEDAAHIDTISENTVLSLEDNALICREASHITLNANYGDPAETVDCKVTKENPVAPANPFSQTGYIFTGWNSAADSSGTAYAIGEEINELTTLFAQWTPCSHKLSHYVGNDNIIIATCECGKHTGTVTLTEPTNLIYDGVAKAAVVETAGWTSNVPSIVYTKDGIEVTPINAGDYTASITVEGATATVDFTIEKAPTIVDITANPTDLTGGGTVTLTVDKSNLPQNAVVSVSGYSNITDNSNGIYTVTLPNEAADYTFTATYAGDDNHKLAEDSCTVSVTRHTGGGGASHPEASDDSSSDRNDRDDDDTENIDEEDVPLTEGKVADFDDVPADAWFAEAVQYVYEHDLMTGVSENLFAPNAQMNRAMVAQILFNVEKPADTEAPAAFRDVAADQWYAKAVNWAVWQGYMSGYGAGSFGPNDALTREQLVTVLWRYSGSPVMGDSSMLNTFSDAAMTSDYAQQAMTWAYAQGVISGNADGTLNPQGTATRAEVATILMRFYENMAE